MYYMCQENGGRRSAVEILYDQGFLCNTVLVW